MEAQQIEILMKVVVTPLSGVLSFFFSVLFLYIYSVKKNRYYLALFLLTLNFSLYSFADFLIHYIVFFGEKGVFLNFCIALRNISSSLFLPSMTLFISTHINFNAKISRRVRLLSLGFLLFVLLISVVGLFKPELLLSVDYLLSDVYWLHITPGPLVMVRDVALLGLALILFVFFLIELFWQKGVKKIIPKLLAIIFLFYSAIDTVLYLYVGFYPDFFPDISFSRGTVAMIPFVLVYGFDIIHNFFVKALSVEASLKSLQNSQNELLQISRSVHEVIFITDYPPQKVIFVNLTFNKIFGMEIEELLEDIEIWKKKVYPDDMARVNTIFSEENLRKKFETEYRIIRNSLVHWVRDRVFPEFDEENRVTRVIRIIEDISERKASEEKLSYLAYHDSLTGLNNRKALYAILGDSLLRMAKEQDFSIKGFLFVDLKNFRDINETAGHNVGDNLLVLVAERLHSLVGVNDHLFRFGGDKFIVVLNDLKDDVEASHFAQKVVDVVSTTYTIEEKSYYIGVNIGISVYPKDGIDIDSLLQNSDIALRSAQSENNRFVFYNTLMNINAAKRVALENDLRTAFKEKDFFLVYQPFYKEGQGVVGMEVLVRWNRDVGPSVFVAAAERNGMIGQLGSWIFGQALHFLKTLELRGYDLRLAVNISPYQFKNPGFVDEIKDLVLDSGVDPGHIELEITEGVVLDDPEAVIAKMHELHAFGLHFSIDDFGTGYSSLSYLKQFPISHLKIDQCFVRDIENDHESRKIINAIVAMAHSLGVAVIGEGVETETQKLYLKSVSCDELQGYLLGRPVRGDEMLELLDEAIKA